MLATKNVRNIRKCFSFYLNQRRCLADEKKKLEIPKNTLEPYLTAHLQEENGAVFDKKPFKMPLEAGKVYTWCLCGKSHTQPMCDGTHKSIYLKIKQKPIRFAVKESKDYWLCNCKQTKNRPFCDGTHKTDDVQNATSRM